MCIFALDNQFFCFWLMRLLGQKLDDPVVCRDTQLKSFRLRSILLIEVEPLSFVLYNR